MKDSLTSQNYRDFRQRYENTFGNFCTKEGKTLMVMLTSVGEDRVTFKDSRGVEYYAYVDSGVPFEFYPVERRLANNKDSVIFSSRKPARMWQRGVCSSNTEIKDVVTGKQLAVNFFNLKTLYNPIVDYQKAYTEYVEGNRMAAALSDKFYVSKDGAYLYNMRIGDFENGTAKIVPLFKQEFGDLITRNNFPIKVEVK